MAHEVESMAYAGEVPWHKLGTKLDPSADVSHWLKASGLDWEAIPAPLHATIGGEFIRVNGRAIIRSTDRKVLGASLGGWKPLQNRDLLEFLGTFARATKGEFESVGSLRGGQRVWGMIRCGAGFKLADNDRVLPYLLFSNSHKPGIAIRVAATAVRVVCANTLTLSEKTDETVYLQSHLKEFDAEGARVEVEHLLSNMEIFRQRAEMLHKLKLSMDDAVRKVLVPVFEPGLLKLEREELDAALTPNSLPRTLGDIIESINKAPGATSGSGWGVLNGVTHWSDHIAGRSVEARLNSSWFGSRATLKQKTLEKLLELC